MEQPTSTGPVETWKPGCAADQREIPTSVPCRWLQLWQDSRLYEPHRSRFDPSGLREETDPSLPAVHKRKWQILLIRNTVKYFFCFIKSIPTQTTSCPAGLPVYNLQSQNICSCSYICVTGIQKFL